ncbi:CLUMA_CG010112, isoform A [Clunio marinus]|uniref:CLUMA_CG010112, isoform A n=1 Tax=Clunio marinus TaxID=568069 RepID=A0A1J1IBY3_9DIPT|nr:CLUMA_CG010112, isoform A [Clunio marinus]
MFFGKNRQEKKENSLLNLLCLGKTRVLCRLSWKTRSMKNHRNVNERKEIKRADENNFLINPPNTLESIHDEFPNSTLKSIYLTLPLSIPKLP